MLAVPRVPFRGIQPFRYVDHAIFLAREEETEELSDLVAIYRGVLLYGASGDGKSSLINAGLMPAVARRRLHPERIRFQPREGEEVVVERIATTDDEGDYLPSLLVREGDGSARLVLSVQAFEERVREICSAAERPLLIFDQFEELITLLEQQGAGDVQREVAQMLVRLLRDPLAVKLLFVFREDYLGKVKHLLAAVPELVDQALRLQPLSSDALPTIIRGPFERHPGHFERELSPQLAERVCAALVQRFGSNEISLSEVETVALRLWQSEDPQTLLQTRGVQGILEDYLGEALDAFSDDERAAAIALLAQMVTSAGTRNVISAEDLLQRVRDEEPELSPTLLSGALERLERESRLIRREHRRDIYLYEITSEFLVPWISQRRQEARLLRERQRDGVYGVAFSGGGRTLASAGGDSTVRLWDARTHKQLGAPLKGHTGAVYDVAFSGDGRTLASAGGDSTVRLWDARTRKQLGAPLKGHTAPVSGVAFSEDGRTLASAGYDNTVRLWDGLLWQDFAELRRRSAASLEAA